MKLAIITFWGYYQQDLQFKTPFLQHFFLDSKFCFLHFKQVIPIFIVEKKAYLSRLPVSLVSLLVLFLYFGVFLSPFLLLFIVVFAKGALGNILPIAWAISVGYKKSRLPFFSRPFYLYHSVWVPSFIGH